MNAWLQWFRRLTFVGIAANLGFILPAIFSPDMFDTVLGPGSSALSYVWLANAGMVLGIATIFYIPAGKDPIKYRLYAWLSVLGRAMASSWWFWQRSRWDLPGPIQGFWVMDGVFCVIFLVLLTMGFRGNKAAASQVTDDTIETPASATDLTRFGWVLRITVILELAFAILGVLVPEKVAEWLQTSLVPFNYVWLGNAALLMIQIAIFSLPAASDPVRYRVYAWLAVAARWSLCIFWLTQIVRWDLTGPSRAFFFVEGVLAIVMTFFLHRGLPASSKLVLSNLGTFIRGLFADVGRVLRSPVDLILATLVAVVGGLFAYGVYVNLIKAEPDVVYQDPVDQYKFGAIGLSMANRIPEYVWNVLPEGLPGPVAPVPAAGPRSASSTRRGRICRSALHAARWAIRASSRTAPSVTPAHTRRAPAAPSRSLSVRRRTSSTSSRSNGSSTIAPRTPGSPPTTCSRRSRTPRT